MNNTIAKKTDNSLKAYLAKYKGEIGKALPAQVGSERFARIVSTALIGNDYLARCTPESFIGCVLNSAQMGLEPNTPLGEAYLIPYRDKKSGTVRCTFQVGYKGLLKLARQSGQISMIKAQTVYENDDFSYQLGLDPDLRHVPAVGDRGNPIAYYAFYKTKDGDFDFEVMYRDEVEKHRKAFSKAENSPWNDNFDSMAKKTVLKKVLKYAPLTTETFRSISQDGSSKDFVKADPEGMKDLRIQPDAFSYEDADFEEHTEPEKIEQPAPAFEEEGPFR